MDNYQLNSTLTSSNSAVSFCRRACSSPSRASVRSSCVFSCGQNIWNLGQAGTQGPPTLPCHGHAGWPGPSS